MSKEDDVLEHALVLLESTANFIRGMAMFDMNVPKETAHELMYKVSEIDAFTDKQKHR